MIVGHYNKLLYKERIDPRLLSRGYTEAQIIEMRESLDNQKMNDLISCNLEFTVDLDTFHYPYFDYCFILFNKYNSHGILPFPDSHSEQPSKIIEIFNVFEQLNFEREEKQLKDQELKRSKEK